MKRLIPIFSAALFLAACTSTPTETETKTIQSAGQQNALAIDTAGLAQFQQWKTQNELVAAAPVQQNEAPVKTVTVVKEVRVKEAAPVRKTVKQTPRPLKQVPVPATQQKKEEAVGGSGDVASTPGTGEANTEGAAGQTEEAKEGGWSNAKKGAVIGSAGGAVIGAVLNKRNRAVGAVIGGVLGGAAGYGLGKKKDKKEIEQ